MENYGADNDVDGIVSNNVLTPNVDVSWKTGKDGTLKLTKFDRPVGKDEHEDLNKSDMYSKAIFSQSSDHVWCFFGFLSFSYYNVVVG